MITGIFALLTGFFHEIHFLISYVSNLNSFPKPLSEEEEKKHLELYMAGDKSAGTVLIEHNLRLVAHVAKKYTMTGKDIDDLISIGTIGLIKGINSYNLNKKTKLATYVGRCIENEILMVIRASKKINNEVSIDEPIGVDKEGNQITFNDILSNENDEVLDEVSRKMQINAMLAALKKTLTRREYDIIVMRYGLCDGNHMTQKQVAKKMNISRSYVSRIEKKAMEKLRNEIKQ